METETHCEVTVGTPQPGWTALRCHCSVTGWVTGTTEAGRAQGDVPNLWKQLGINPTLQNNKEVAQT